MAMRRWGSSSVVNTAATNDQKAPQVCGLKDGGYVVVWEDASLPSAVCVKFQRFDALGAKAGLETIVVSPDGSGHQSNPSIAALENGTFAIAHQDHDAGANQITITRYAANGALLGQFQFVNNGQDPHIQANEFDTGYSVAYMRETGATPSIAIACLQANGTVTSDTLIDSNGIAPQMTLNSGVVFARSGTPGIFSYQIGTNPAYDVQVEGTVADPHYAAGGAYAFAVFTEITAGGQHRALIVSCWPGYGTSDPQDLASITGQAYAEGINIFGHDDGTFTLLWSEPQSSGAGGREIHMRQVAPGENTPVVAVGPEITLSETGTQIHGTPSVSKLADGRLVVVWVDSSAASDGSGSAILHQILDPREGYVQGSNNSAIAETLVGNDALGDTILGLAGNDTLYGLAGSDTLYGDDGSDTLQGGRGDDTLYGGHGADKLYGNAGDDVIHGGAGDDSIYLGRGEDAADGGDGFDTLSYYAHSQGAIIDMTNQTLNAGAALDHTFTRIERINGSENFGDTLKGDALANTLAGFGGVDTLTGNGGDDILRGGDGADILSGGTGADKFRYDAITEGGDSISSFSSLDDFQFLRSAFGNLAGANVDVSQFLSVASGNTATSAAHRFIFDQSTETLWFDANGDSSGGLALIATIQTNTTLTHLDLLLI